MEGLHHVNGVWVVDDEGQEGLVEGDFVTLSILAKRLKCVVDDLYYHRRMGRFPTYRIKETRQYLVLPDVADAIVDHFLKHTMWLTFRIEGDEIVMYNERYGSRPVGRQALADTGRLHTPSASARLAIAKPLDAADQGVDQ